MVQQWENWEGEFRLLIFVEVKCSFTYLASQSEHTCLICHPAQKMTSPKALHICVFLTASLLFLCHTILEYIFGFDFFTQHIVSFVMLEALGFSSFSLSSIVSHGYTTKFCSVISLFEELFFFGF